jgi:hypothetical protein
MPKPFRMTSARPLPANAEIVEHDGKPHVRLKERGRVVLCPLSEDGTQYLKPSKCWYFEYRDRNGTVKRLKGFTDLKATEQMAAETERKAARLRVGLIDPTDEHVRRPLAEHLNDYRETLTGKGNTQKHVALAISRITALLNGCQFAQ